MSDSAKPGWIPRPLIAGAGTALITVGAAISYFDLTYGSLVSGFGVVVVTCSVIPKKPQKIKWDKPAAIPWQPNLTLANSGFETAKPIEGNGNLTYAHDSNAPLEPGTIMLTANLSETTTYYAASKKVQVTVTKAKPVITWNPATPFNYGTQLSSAAHLNAVASVPGTMQYDRALGDVLDAGDTYVQVKFTPHDTVHYDTVVNVRRDLHIDPIPSNVVWPPAPIAIPYRFVGRQVPVVVTFGGAAVAGLLRYNNQNLNGNVGIGPLAGGPHALAVTFIPNSHNYLQENGVVNLQVTPSNPVLAWNPNEVDDSAALGPNQLNATATFQGQNVPGVFVYAPLAGLVVQIAAPAPVMTVTFTPAVAANFNTPAAITIPIPIVLTAAQRLAGGIGPAAIRTKILYGSIVGGNTVGAHSARLVDAPDPNTHQIANVVVNPNGTRSVEVQVWDDIAGAWTPPKNSTIPPAGWTDLQFLKATVTVGAPPNVPAVNLANGWQTYNAAFGGINWRVVKDAGGQVVASYTL